MSSRRPRGGDADTVAEQGLGLGLELGEVEVGTAVFQGDHELSGIGAEFDSGDPVPGCKLGQKAGRFPEQSIIGAGQIHTRSLRRPSAADCPLDSRWTLGAADALASTFGAERRLGPKGPR